MNKPYNFAPDCPNCGEKDAKGEWKGARMSSSVWGHAHSCCSDKCGYEFASSPKRRAIEKAAIKEQISALKQQLGQNQRVVLREPDNQVADLAMLVRQLASQLKNSNPKSDLPARAFDYLKRKGLEGNILRTHNADQS